MWPNNWRLRQTSWLRTHSLEAAGTAAPVRSGGGASRSGHRLNQSHPETIFRVRVGGLQPQTTYYYKVTSMGADGESDGVETAVNQFTTPASGERIVAYPQPK
jgi:hypothetical protein